MSTPIIVTVTDGNNVHCFDEPMLDAWWSSLPAEEKAVIFEADLEGHHRLAEPRPHPDYLALAEYSAQFLKEQL